MNQTKGKRPQCYLLFALFFLFLTACGQSSTGSSAGGGVAATAPLGIRLIFPESVAGKNQKLSATSAESITRVRITATPTFGDVVTQTIDAFPGETVRIRLILPTKQNIKIEVLVLGLGEKVLFFGQGNTVVGGAGEIIPVIDIVIDIPLTISSKRSTVPTRSTTGVSIALSDAFLASLEGGTITWRIEGTTDGSKGIITLDPDDPSSAIYTAPDIVPESGSVEITAVSDENPNVFETVVITIIPSEKTLIVSNTGFDVADCGTEASPCRTVTKALSLSVTGDTVLIQAGHYLFSSGVETPEGTELAPLVMEAGVKLIGAGSDQTFLDFAGPFINEVSIVGADNAVLAGFTITDLNGTDDNNLIETDDNNMTIRDNIFLTKASCSVCDTFTTGIRVFGAGTPVITGNTFGGPVPPLVLEISAGLFSISAGIPGILEAGISVEDASTPLIGDNTFENNATGIAISGNAKPVLEGNTLVRNKVGVLVSGLSAPDLGSPPSGSIGSNILSCNTLADLDHRGSKLIFAQNNQWDHAPPMVSSLFPGEGGEDIILPIGRDSLINSDGATLAITPCATRTLTLTQDGSGSGSVSGAGPYDFGSDAPVSETANTDSIFAGWFGPDGTECETGIVNMVANKSCTARFNLKTVKLTINIVNGFFGTVGVSVTSPSFGSTCKTNELIATCSDFFNIGTVVTLTPDPFFVFWTGVCAGFDGPPTVTMDADKICTATFFPLVL